LITYKKRNKVWEGSSLNACLWALLRHLCFKNIQGIELVDSKRSCPFGEAIG